MLAVRAEVESLQISVKYITEDIQQLTVTNTDEEINDETDDDYDSDIDMSLSQLKDKLTCESHMKNPTYGRQSIS